MPNAIANSLRFPILCFLVACD